MRIKFPEILCVALISLAACGGGGSGGGGYSAPTTGGSTPAPPTGVASLTIGVALPSGTIGVENDPVYGIVGGYTQAVYSQVMAFAPGASVRIQNLSSTTTHTLNVIGTVSGAPSFPANPTLSSAAAGTPGTLDANYASGNIAPGAIVGPVTLTAGTYYLGCAYHYLSPNNMRSALVVAAAATPGPQATPQPTTGGGVGGSGCVGSYC